MATKADDAHKHALQLMGKLIPAGTKRDAVHIAVAPVVNRYHRNLSAGDHVAWHPDHVGTGVIQAGSGRKAIGIIDPYLSCTMGPGERCFLFLYPMTTTSLRHQWTHPDFPEEDVVVSVPETDSEAWITNWLSTSEISHVSYEKFMQALKTPGEYVKFGSEEDGDDYSIMIDEYINSGGSDAHGVVPDELWDHVENVLGKKLRTRPEYFSCSC